jgi:hypothetical protein
MTKKKDIQDFPEKDLKKLPDTFADSVAAMKEDELKKIIVECEGNVYIINQAQKEDEKLNAAKELSRELTMPYREARQCQQAKIHYCLWLLDGRGVDLDHTEASD